MIDDRIAAFPSRTVAVSGGRRIAYREAGSGKPLVLLHGIGSGAASWLFQLEGLADRFRVIAWDAPGYGESDLLPIDQPGPADYANALDAFLTSLGLHDFLLAAQSLGCLMAGAYARAHPQERLLLISPAGGYKGDHGRIADRLKQLEILGPDGLAEKRAGGMLSPNPPEIALELVRWNYRRIRHDGYRQASYCLANGDLRADAPFCTGEVLVACGTADTVTPEAGCRDIAAHFPRARFSSLPGLGHASPVEGPQLVNDMIRSFA